MADGLFDFFQSPQGMGLLGALQGLGNARAPQAASRLPLAQPNLLNTIGQIAGGYGGGLTSGTQNQETQARTGLYGQQANLYGQQAGLNQIKTASDLQQYNFWARATGQPELSLPDTLGKNGTITPKFATPQTPTMQMPGGTVTPTPMPTPEALPGASPTPAMPMPSMPGAQPTAPLPSPPMPMQQQGGAAPMGAPSGGAAPSAASPTDYIQKMMLSQPPPVLEHFGIKVPEELKTAYAAGVQPGSPQWMQIAQQATLKALGIGGPIGGTQPGVPIKMMQLNTATGMPELYMPGGSEDAAKREAELRLKERGREKQQDIYGTTGIIPPMLGVGGPPQAAPQAPPGFSVGGGAGGGAMQAAPQGAAPSGRAGMEPRTPQGDVITDRGTVVPKAPQVPFTGTDALNRMNAMTEKTEENFGAVRPSLDATEGRLQALAQVYREMQTGGLAEKKAEMANILRGAGLPADWIMNEKDTASVQKALGVQVQEVLGQLKQINAGTGGRILNSEFQSFLGKQTGPNLAPEANFSLLTQALGGVYQTRNLIDDYYNHAKPNGWRDANAYMSKYFGTKENSYANAVKYAEDAIGPLKGMAASGGAALPPPDAIKHLQMNPNLAPAFEEKYGAGSALQFTDPNIGYRKSRGLPMPEGYK